MISICSTTKTSGRIRTDYFQQDLLTSRESNDVVLRLLTKPQSTSALQKAPSKMNILKCPDMLDDQKKSRNHSSALSNSSFQREVSSQNSKKITRRLHSADIVKPSQITSNNSNNNRRSDCTMPMMHHRSSIVATTKSSLISPNSQSIILFCMENARSDIALRIIQRMTHKRDDFAQFYANLSNEQSVELIRQISNKYGIEQAHKRSWGFKADFFALLADALTTECVFLDGAAHQPTETIEAWATLVELMFTNVRDGYYMETRQLRRNWQNFNSQSNLSSQSDQSFDGDPPHSLSSLSYVFTT
ncbi:hypothetical protein DINM_002624 [Dirofilaria immitis]|nr:hypothetical protein [Dirofilaria immitis]